jgi:signal transduction histidine kinase
MGQESERSTFRAGEESSPADELGRRRAYLGLADEDVERARALSDVFGSFLDDFVEHFYSHLLAHPETAGFLTSPDLVVRLKETQRQYFESLFEARLDAAYVDDRRRIGRAHAEVGLEPQWYLGAYNQYMQYCFREFAGRCGGDLGRYADGTLTVLKILLLDMGLALDAYFAQSTGQLRKALELLAQSNTELREFARLASHDLKTPLATVAGYCEEFLDEFGDRVPEAGRSLIEAARARTLELARTIGELLSISEASAQPEQRTRVPTRRILDEVLERLRPELELRPIRVVLPNGLPDVWGHPSRLHEVFYALLSNAIKYLDKEEGIIRLECNAKDGEQIFCVSDNGPGIPENELKAIFAPFRRLPRHRGYPGSGLGLHFVKTLVEEQGGRAWVESHLGEGSRFFVAWPARDE